MNTTITTPISSREEILEKSEFSLVETSTGNIAGQLRFPPGLDRIAIRELVAELRQKSLSKQTTKHRLRWKLKSKPKLRLLAPNLHLTNSYWG